MEAAFRAIDGIISTEVVSSGSDVADSSYEHVLTGDTGHAEFARVEFEPVGADFEKLLEVSGPSTTYALSTGKDQT